MLAGLAVHEAELISFAEGGCIVHRLEQRS